MHFFPLMIGRDNAPEEAINLTSIRFGSR